MNIETKPPKSVIAAIKSRPPLVSHDRLIAIRDKMRLARDLLSEINDVEERLADLKHRLYEIQGGGHERGELVDLMEAAGMRSFTLEAEGNHPAYDVKLQPFYGVEFPKGDEERKKAFDYISKDMGVPDIIKNIYAVSFGKGEAKMAAKLEKLLKAEKLFDRTDIDMKVHAQTLKAEVKRRFDKGEPLSPAGLETIGVTVGKIVKMKQI